MENEEYTPNIDENRNIWTTVTPLSKYLALFLVITLPFLGGWVGYTNAPVKVVEVTQSVQSEGSSENVVSDDLLSSTDVLEPEVSKVVALTLEDLIYFEDTDIGISFYYPSVWGPVSVEDEGNITDKTLDVPCNTNERYRNDPCNLRMLTFEGLGYATIFLATETLGHHENPVGRGAFWGDFTGDISESYLENCRENFDCIRITNSNNVTFAKIRSQIEYFDAEYRPYSNTYIVYNSGSPYYGISLSTTRFVTEFEEAEQVFEKSVINSFKFLE